MSAPMSVKIGSEKIVPEKVVPQKIINETTRAAQANTMLSPRFYTTDFAAMDRLDVSGVRAEWDELIAELRRKFSHQLLGEFLLLVDGHTEAQTELGVVPREALETIKAKANFDVKRVLEIEETTKHDVIAFLTNVAEYVGEPGRGFSFGATRGIGRAFTSLGTPTMDLREDFSSQP